MISGTGAPGLVIHREDVEAALAARRGPRPLFLIDIAVPRDIEAAAAELDGVFLYDLDDLRSVAEANLRERRKEAAAAEAIVEREVREFLDWQKSLDAVPLLVELRRRGDEIRRHEIEKAQAPPGLADPGAGGGPRGRTTRHRQQAAPRADGPPQGSRRGTATRPSRSP